MHGRIDSTADCPIVVGRVHCTSEGTMQNLASANVRRDFDPGGRMPEGGNLPES